MCKTSLVTFCLWAFVVTMSQGCTDVTVPGLSTTCSSAAEDYGLEEMCAILEIAELCCETCSYTAVNCPDGWTPSADSNTCFSVSTDALTWSQARDVCQAQGGDLVKIVDEAMNQLLSDFADPLIYTYAWIGLNKQDDGTWMWLDEGTEPEYTNFEDETVHEGEDCVTLCLNNEYWYDEACETAHEYICEIPPTADTSDVTTPKIIQDTTAAIEITTSADESSSSAGLAAPSMAVVVVVGILVAVLRPSA